MKLLSPISLWDIFPKFSNLVLHLRNGGLLNLSKNWSVAQMCNIVQNRCKTLFTCTKIVIFHSITCISTYTLKVQQDAIFTYIKLMLLTLIIYYCSVAFSFSHACPDMQHNCVLIKECCILYKWMHNNNNLYTCINEMNEMVKPWYQYKN